MAKVAKIITATALTVMVEGYAPYTMAATHKYFATLKKAVQESNVKDILNVIQLAEQATNYMDDKIVIQNGAIFYEGEQVTTALADRIIQCMNDNEDPKGMIEFLKNLMKNPSKQSREELYLFLEACGDLPITEDGRFIAYKWVNDDYKDCRTGKFDNSIGAKPKMRRRDVDDDRRRTCSKGLHVCSSKYDKFGSKLMLVAVNPEHVVSVPNDYDNGKMRVCEYEVMAEIDQAEYTTFDKAVYRA